MKKYTLEELEDKHIGVRGTPRREKYEEELKLDLLGVSIRSTRKQRNLTQTELGNLIGVQKAQISKIENNASNVTLGTVLKVFNALNAKVKFSVELAGEEVAVMG